MMAAGMQLVTLLVIGRTAGGEAFATSYEVIAPDAEAAARLAFADMAKRDEKPLDVEDAEVRPLANPLLEPGVRFRAGRRFYET